MNQSPLLLSAKEQKSLVTVKEIAEACGVSSRSVRYAIARIYPGKMKDGVTTYLTEEECTVIIDELKHNKAVKEQLPSNQVTRLESTQTDLTPALMLAQASEQMQKALEAVIAQERQYSALLEEKMALQQPKVDFYDAVADSKDAIDMARVANVLNIKGYGRNKLFSFLRDHNILQSNNSPYQEYIDRGYFRVIETKWQRPDGEVCIYLKTIVQQKGVEFIRNKVLTSKEYIDAAIPDVADKLMDKGLLGD